MNQVVEAKEYRFDSLKWAVVIGLLVAGIVGNSYFSDFAVLYRVLALVAIAVVAAFVAVQTASGAKFWTFLREAQVELRRVVWPTNQEVNQTTLVVLAVVVIMGILLWMLDSLLGWLASLIIG